ncbi:branched-chain amino acid ABC transporter permease [Oceanobacillus sp. J11TS1]|uniref:branched-chain amino acid ABC transporter permease n=1 Tax=Oceanobacillus sp. J11TS1 TaxID=2807191 RepID=UPI001AFD27A4|nr:branched-chain amino acid ABC transporter permease [Oceanobacillus sp. J11TS1]GIO23640.1 branched-chain amino acid ABC transporter permease [Oceanobacillus sp. J11TS1]
MRGVKKTNWWGVASFIVIMLFFPLIINGSYYVTQGTFAGIYTIAAIGLGLLMGYAGLISLGQAAFYGVGAYTTAILTTSFGFSPWLGLIFSILVSALLALIMGYTMAKLSGYYLAMATLALGMIVNVIFVEWKSVTQGAQGLYGIPNPELFGFQITQGVPYYYLVWGIATLVIIVSMNIVHSRVGRALRSIHDSETAASSMGVETGKYKMQIFIFSAILAGIAGWLFAHMNYSISPSSFTFDTSILFLAMVVLGGATSIWGAVFGTILITAISVTVHELGQSFSFITTDFEHVLYGFILMMVVIFLPRGLFPSFVSFLKNFISSNKKSNSKRIVS